jgi:hypothetical protein
MRETFVNVTFALLWVSLSFAPSVALSSNDASISVLPPKRVGVVSLLGESFHGIGMGLTRFGNVDYSPQVSDWRIDSDAASFLLSALSSRGCSASLLDIEPKRAEDFFLKGHADDPNLVELRRMAADRGFDTVLVVVGAPDAHVSTIQPGYGLFEQGAFGIHNVYPYAMFRVTVLDVSTGKEFASKYAYATGGRDKAIPWKTNLDEYSEDERSLIKKAIEEHVHGEMTRILDAMKILPSAH